MKKPKKIFLLALLATAFAFCSDARAQQSYEIVFGQSNYDVFEGSSVNVDVLLRETVTGGATARLASGNEDGLFAFAFNADFSSTTGATGSSVATTADVLIDAIFDDTTFNDVNLLGSSVDVTGVSSDTTDGVEVAETSPGVFEVPLATLVVTAGDLDSVTTFTLADHTNNGDTFFIDGFTADPVINFGSSTVTVLAVPEPGSAIVLAGLFGAGLLRRRKR